MDHPEVRFRFWHGFSDTALEWEKGDNEVLRLVAQHYQWVLYNYNLALAGNESKPNARIIADCIRLEKEVDALDGLILFLDQQLGLEIKKAKH